MAGAAVDLTLVDVCGDELDMGTPIDATPEQSDGALLLRRRRASAPRPGRTATCWPRCSAGAGLVNYPTEWWHWSYGDRYWALVTGAAARAVRTRRPRRWRHDRRSTALPHRPTPAPRLDVDLAAVAANTRLFADRTPGALMAVVKADGFGHGAVDVARTALANGATWLGVTSVDEASPLRGAGLAAPVLSWLNPVDADFEPPRSRPTSTWPCRAASTCARSPRRRAAGAPACTCTSTPAWPATARQPASWAGLCRGRPAGGARRARPGRRRDGPPRLRRRPRTTRPTPRAGPAFAWGARAWRAAAACARALRHLAATAATLTDPRTHHDLCRVGAGLVGIDPSGTTAPAPRR